MYLLRFPRNYINIFIYYAESSKIRTFRICKQTDVSPANRRHGAACMLAGVHLAACGVLRWCALRVATSGGVFIHTGGGTPPVGAPNHGRPPFSEFFFIFFEEEEHKQE